MSLLDTASLIVTPNGYNEGKLYSVIPSDGSGDLSVTRATTATRVNSAGLVELVPYNLLTYSNTFSNAAWNKINSTVTSGQSGYDGSTNAWKLQATATNNCEVDQGFSESETKTFSIYAKAGNVNFVAISVFGAGFGWYNLSNGTLGSSGGTFVSRDIESVGNGWYRCSIVTNVAASGVAVYVCNADNSITTSVGSNIFIQNSQLESGSVPTTYQKTETRLNIPRLDYSNGTCPSILVEPQRTNLTLYSEDINSSYWVKQGGTLTSNATNSPSGIQNADLFTENTSNVDHAIFDVVTYFVAGTTYTASFYAKANGRTKIELVSANSGTCPSGRFDLVAETATALGTSFNAKIESVGNGWYRCSVSRVAPNNGLDVPYYAMVQTFGTITYTGDGTSGMYFWGMQMEAGSYATSYIPTTSASVTRNADVISKTGISSLIGQTEGVFYSEFTCDFKNPNGSIPIYLRGSGGGGSYSYSTYVQMGANNFNVLVFSNNVAQLSLNSGTLTDGQMVKMAFAYKANDFVLYINGVQTSFYNAGTPSIGLNALDFGSYFAAPGVFDYDGYIKSFALWKTRLTNDQLATLTTI